MDNEKMKELTEEELKKVAGGLDSGDEDDGLAETPSDGDEVLDRSLRRFRRSSDHDTIIQELRRREPYEKPTVTRKITTGRIRAKKCK